MFGRLTVLPANLNNPLTLFDGLLTIMDNEVTGATLYSGRPALTVTNVLMRSMDYMR